MKPHPHPNRVVARRARRRLTSTGVLAAALLGAPPATAELPDAATLLSEIGFSADEIARIESGQLVRHSVPAGSERELTTGMAFQVPISPDALIESSRRALLEGVDESMIGFGAIGSPASPSDFAKLTLKPQQVKAYPGAEPGGELNLSKQEIAAFQALGSGATPDAVEEAVREALVARVQAYRSRGLDGIAPYALGEGAQRSPAEELRIATNGAKHLAKHAPEAHRLLTAYPDEKPPGTEEIFRWTHFEAHGVPTIALNHLLLVPDGDAWLLGKRQFYVSSGYNAEQAVAVFLPTQDGTVVVYGTHVSTDQVAGFGGGTKRSIGSKLLASQLEALFEKGRAEAR